MSTSGPNVLRVQYKPIYLQVRDWLLADSDATYGILSALGAGARSIYPSADFSNDGPTPGRDETPTPFLIVYDGGKKALDPAAREHRVLIELHDDRDNGNFRWPGLLQRLYVYLLGGRDLGNTLLPGFRPTDDQMNRYSGGLYFIEESPILPDERDITNGVLVLLGQRSQDRSSNRGYEH